jgi:hypothetical protein
MSGVSARRAGNIAPLTYPDMTEKHLLSWVRQAARLLGWRCYHTWNSIHSERGFPDLVLCKPPRLLVIELKGPRGKVTGDQQDWLNDLAACGISTAVWRPDDLEHILDVLKGVAETRSALAGIDSEPLAGQRRSRRGEAE